MRALIALPHFSEFVSVDAPNASWSVQPEDRARRLLACLRSIHRCFGVPQLETSIAELTASRSNQRVSPARVDVIICTTGERHALRHLPADVPAFTQVRTDAEPMFLGWECHAMLRRHHGAYDFYCYLEDDLIVHDPWFFAKLAQFDAAFGPDVLLQPNRFEAPTRPGLAKAYIDGDLPDDVITPFVRPDRPTLSMEVLGVTCEFVHARNPHAGAFFLTAMQFDRWAASRWFMDRDPSFAGPLESAATLGLLRCFDVYKPARETRSFLEIEHYGQCGSANIGTVIRVGESV